MAKADNSSSTKDWPWLYDALMRAVSAFGSVVLAKEGREWRPPRVSFRFTDEQWKAICSVRESWPGDIDWVQARDGIERLGRTFLMVRTQRSHLGSPVKIRDGLRTALRLIRELHAAMNALPAPLRECSPDPTLEDLDRRLRRLLVGFEYLAGPTFRGRRDPHRNYLELGLFAFWKYQLNGDLSFSRRVDGTPFGPLVKFLTLTLHAITGSAPGPAGIAKIIDRCRKGPYFPD
jgi:hypothetical protein